MTVSPFLSFSSSFNNANPYPWKRPRDKNYNDHVVKGTKRVSEQDFAKSPVIERAEQVQANLSAEFPSFFKIMIPSVVCRGFWMKGGVTTIALTGKLGFMHESGSLPKEFCQLNLPNHDATVILVGETGKEYRINFLVQRKALSGGWKRFSKEHGLLVGDALVFHLIRPSKFKVYIVRMNGLDEIDAALGLLRLQNSANQTGIWLKKTSQRMALWMLAPLKWKALGLLRLLALQMPLELPEISTPRSGFVPWDNALNSFDFLGTDVGSLHKRVHHVLNHTFESKQELKLKYKEAKLERAYAEQETKSLESDLSGKKEEMQRLDAEIDALTVNAKRYELMFEAAANAPW
ncbi:hypothetical protein GOBAR_AA28878 [Gossypium barbadense]|uniref:TF-B3 domain-containing protein n=1 Tax=Gossypium barbadense TaxID=3634 RepID=A0A2P5WL38_GOSBA|nr:hypothetical protein GOBAR_AA28878 [Gossypium barbadense]